MKKTKRRKITSSLNEISVDQLKYRMVWGGGGTPTNHFYKKPHGQLFKDDVNGLSSVSDVCFMRFKPCGKLFLSKSLICKIDGFYVAMKKFGLSVIPPTRGTTPSPAIVLNRVLNISRSSLRDGVLPPSLPFPFSFLFSLPLLTHLAPKVGV